MLIGEAARRAGLTVKAVRYYERAGLLPPPRRRGMSGYRVFGPDELKTLRFIRKARATGFGISELRTLLGICRADSDTCSRVRGAVGAKLRSVRREIRRLERLSARLETLHARLGREARRKPCVCPILGGC